MKRSLTIFLQTVIILIGIGALAFMLWEPHLEGRNAHATVFEVYFNDPFLAYVYIASIPFFVMLYRAFKMLRYPPETLKSLSVIKYCALSLIVSILVAEAYLFIIQRGKEEDIAGGVVIGIFMMLVFAATGTIAAMFERRLKIWR